MTETVNLALAEFVRRKRLEKLAASPGSADLDPDDRILEEIRRNE